MAIGAINSINAGKVGFRGVEPASKKPASEKAEAKKSDDNFFEENKEAILGLSAVGAAALGALALYKTGAFGKFVDKVSKKDPATSVADNATNCLVKNANPNDRTFDGAFGEKGLKRIKQAINTLNVNNAIDEFGPDGARHAERVNSQYEKALPEIFAEGAKVNKREDVLAYARVMDLN